MTTRDIPRGNNPSNDTGTLGPAANYDRASHAAAKDAEGTAVDRTSPAVTSTARPASAVMLSAPSATTIGRT